MKFKKDLCFFLIFFLIVGNHTFFTAFALEPMDWWERGWKHWKPIIIHSSYVYGKHLDFPVLIDIIDSSIGRRAQIDGDDILFTDDKNEKLSHEIESYNSSTGHLIAWVKVPLISFEEDTRIFIYYGNPECSNQEDSMGVWDSHYRMVLHLSEEEGSVLDSSKYSKNGSVFGGVKRGVHGVIDGAYDYYVDYEMGYVEIPHNGIRDELQAFTASFWIRLEDVWNRQVIIGNYDTSADQRSWLIAYYYHPFYGSTIRLLASEDGRESFEWFCGFLQDTDSWFHVTVVWESRSIPKFYLNSAQLTTFNSSTITTLFNSTRPIQIAKSNVLESDLNYFDFDGYLDEIRFSNVVRNINWIKTEYINQYNPNDFISVGEAEPLPDTPVIYNSKPDNLDIIRTNQTELSFNLLDYQYDLMNYTVSTRPHIGSVTEFNVLNGKYSLPVSEMAPGTYSWKIEVTDGVNQISKTSVFIVPAPGEDVEPPSASAGPDIFVKEDTIIHLDGSNSTDNIAIQNYTWSFIDEEYRILNGIQLTYAFTEPGIYHVKLVVIDSSGNSDIDSVIIHVSDETNPTAKIKLSREMIFIDNYALFDGSDSFDNINITSYEWDFGNNITESGIRVNHIYQKIGVYNVTLTVQDAAGNKDYDWIEVTVNPRGSSDANLLFIFIIFFLLVIFIGCYLFTRERVTRSHNRKKDRKVYKIKDI